MASETQSDESLIRRASTDPAAAGELYRRHVDAVLAFVYRRCGDVEVAADVTAETFAAALLSSKRFRPGPVPVRGWLFGIARHKLVDSQRSAGAERRARERLGIRQGVRHGDDIEALEARLDARQFGEDALRLVDDLPAAERAAVVAVVLDDRDLAEVALELDLTVPTLRQRVRRGVGRLSKSVNGDNL